LAFKSRYIRGKGSTSSAAAFPAVFQRLQEWAGSNEPLPGIDKRIKALKGACSEQKQVSGLCKNNLVNGLELT